MSVANQYEVQMLALINAARAAAGLQPLKLNAKLNTSAENHSLWMLQADVFSHTGANGSSATDRMRAAGYAFEGNWANGENIAWQSERGVAGIADDVINFHQSLMNSPGHRANILNPNFVEIGIGIEAGEFTTGGTNWPAVTVTQNFARSSADNGGPGAGTPPNPTPPNPTPTVTEQADIVNGTAKAELIDALGGNDRVSGLGGNDTLRGRQGDDSLYGGDGGDSLYGGDGNDQLEGGLGNDRLLAEAGNDVLLGGGGNDVLTGGLGNDSLSGEAGSDRLYGNEGRDFLFGGAENDRLEGGADADTLAGGTGIDTLRGDAGNDRLFGDAGNDRLLGNDGDDWLEGGLGADVLTGGTGADSFIFRKGAGADQVLDFTDNADTLVFGGGLWNGSMSAKTFVSTYGHMSGTTAIFDFGGGNIVTVNGVASLQQFYDDVSLIA